MKRLIIKLSTATAIFFDILVILMLIVLLVPTTEIQINAKDRTVDILAVYLAFLWFCSRVNWLGYKRGWKHGQVSGWQAHVDYVKKLLKDVEKVVEETTNTHSTAYNNIKAEMLDCSKPDADCDADYKPNL